MSEEDKYFIKRYEELLDKGYCDCNEMNCIDNNSPRRILNIVKVLQTKLQQKENIIKEVREWAKKCSCQFTNDDGELVVSEISFNIQARPCDLFKILDKAGNSNERNKDNK